MRKFAFILFFVFIPLLSNGQIRTNVDGVDWEFSTLKDAFTFVNTLGVDLGDVVLHVTGNTVESDSAVLLPSGWDYWSLYNSITIVPDASGYTIGGEIDGPVICIVGASNLIIDGRVGGSGTTADLTIANTSTGDNASTIRFIESANNNTVQYCNLQGTGPRANRGIIFFSEAASGSGNNNNLITSNNISGIGSGRPANAIFSLGSAGFTNSNNTISQNNFFDHLRLTIPSLGTFSTGIYLSTNNSAWTISGNSFYEQQPLSPQANCSYSIIYISNAGTGYNINGNYIGGRSASCAGGVMTKSGYNNIFYGIRVLAGTGTPSVISGNQITNISWSNSGTATWTGIEASGEQNITSNVLGSDTGTGSVTYTAGTSGGSVTAISLTGTGTINCNNNIIGSITAANAVGTGGTSFTGIVKSNTGGITTINNNFIGSSTTANSINASSLCTSSSQNVLGISNSGTGNISLSGNTIANMTNASATISGTTSRIAGIYSVNGTDVINGNTIYNLTIGSNNITQTNSPSVAGIALAGNSLKTVNGNTIYGLKNVLEGFKGYIYGIYFTGNATGTNEISKNFIHSLSVNDNSSDNFVMGIRLAAGSVKISNNIIRLGGNTRTTIYGIHDPGTAYNNTAIYFNTVVIKGTAPTGTWGSYALYNSTAGNSRDYRNNIFANFRTTPTGTAYHFAIYFVAPGGTITCNNNDYFAPYTAAMPGYYDGNKTTLPIVTGNDGNSLIQLPQFIDVTGMAATDFKLTSNIAGGSGTTIETDFGNFARTATPTVGAWEFLQNKWIGSVNTVYNLAGNWSANAVPTENCDLEFDAAAVNDCYLDADHIVKNVTNATARKLVANGHKLTVTGTMALSGGALIDANAPSSTLAFAGTSAQTINTAEYSLGSVNDLLADNAAGVTVNSNFIINGNLTINMARSLIVSAPNLLVVNGSITNNAGASGLILRSTANGTDARLINNTDLVSATVELFLSGGSGTYGPRYHYITPPVQTMSINNSSVSACATSLGLTSFYGDLLLFNESKATTSKNAGWQYFDGYAGTTGFNTLTSTRGYNMRLPISGKMTFTGQLNAIEHTYSLSYTGSIGYPGWNLIGNPYPCNYDLTSISAFTAADNVDNTAYFNYEGGYGTWNFSLNSGTLNGSSTTVFSPVVAPMQGVYVHVTAPATINLPVSGKTANGSQPSRAKSSSSDYIPEKIVDLKKIKLSLNYNNIVDETLICLLEGATEGFDSNYDAYRMPEEIAPRGWSGNLTNPSIATGAGSMKFAINSLPVPDPLSQTIIPVSLNIKEAGTYTITVPEFENLEGTQVVLKHGGVEIKLSKGTTYKFTSLPGSFDNLALIIGSMTTGNEETTAGNNKFRTWFKNDQLYILAPDALYSSAARLQVYDIQGKSVSDKNIVLTPGGIINVPLSLRGGIYLAHITADNKAFVNKFVVVQ